MNAIRLILFITFIPMLIVSIPAVAMAQSEPTTVYDVDTFFRPARDGFSFENYRNHVCIDKQCQSTYPVVNLTGTEIRRLFSDIVCRTIDGYNRCDLYTVVRQWMNTINRAMDYGHCEGMAVLSSLMYSGVIDPIHYGAETVFDLRLEDNLPLQKEIAYWYATQSLIEEPVYESDPVSQLKMLIRSFQESPGSPMLIGMYRDGHADGHAVLAYAIDARENHTYHIMVYDSNFPGEERFISVDVSDNSWAYKTKLINDNALISYSGKGLNNPFQLYLSEERLGAYSCDFCPPEAQRYQDKPQDMATNIAISSDVNLFIETDEGKKMGYDWIDKKVYREIPDAEIHRTTGQTYARISNDIPYYLWLNRPESLDWSTFDVSIATPGSVLNLSNVLESYEFPNIIYRPTQLIDDEDFRFETFEIVAYPKYLPNVGLILSNRLGECFFDFSLSYEGNDDLSSKINVYILNGYSVGMFGIELYAAKNADVDLFKDAVFTIDSNFTCSSFNNRYHFSTEEQAPLQMKINSSLFLDFESWQNSGMLYITGDMDGDWTTETIRLIQ